jgi:hypothetical protein
MMIAGILRILVGLAGLAALALGLVIWIAGAELTDLHVLFGLLVTLGLLVMSVLALTTRELRLWGIVGIVYAIIMPIFGERQVDLLMGPLHWLVETLHLLVGLGALALTGLLAARYTALKRGQASPRAE